MKNTKNKSIIEGLSQKVVEFVNNSYSKVDSQLSESDAQKLNEEKIRYFAILLENVFDAIIATDLNYNIKFWNFAAEKQYGWTSSDVIGKPLEMFIQNDYLGISLDVVIRKISQDGYWKGEVTQNRRDGTRIPIISIVSSIKNDAGQISGYIAVNRDITDHKHEEQVLKESEAKYKAIIDAAPIGIGIAKGFKTTSANAALQEILGYTESELVTKPFIEIFHPDDRPIIQERINKRSRGEIDNSNVQTRIIRKNGSIRFVDLTTSEFYVDTEQFTQSIFIDITERKQTEEALHNERTLFRTVIDLIPDAIYVKNAEGKKILSNPKEIQLAGKSSEDEIIGKTDFNLYPDIDTNRSQEEDQFVLNTGTPILNIESTLVGNDGKPISLLGSKVPLRDIYGKITGIVGVNHDVTQRKRVEAELLFKTTLLEAESETSIDGILAVDNESKVILYNKRFGEIWNIPQHIIDKKDDNDLLEYVMNQLKYPEEFRNKVAYLYKHSDEKSRDEIEFIDGKFFDRYSTPLISNYGKYIGRIWFFRDITQSKLAENALLESEAKYRLLIENLNEGIWHIDKDANTTFVNSCMAKMLGYTPEEMIGKHLFEFMDERGVEIAKEKLESRQKGVQEQHDFEFIRKDGNRIYAILATGPIVDLNGNYIGSVAGVQDITERRKVENELVIEKQRLSDIIKGTNVGTWEWNIQTGETIFNEQWAEFIGYTLEEISPISINTWVKYTHPEDLKKSGELLEKHFKGELDYYEFEARMKHKNGNWIWVLDRGRVHDWDKDGKPLLMSGTHQNVTERKETEQRIQSSIIEAEERERMHFSQELHDGIGPLLSATKMYVQWLGMPDAKLDQDKIIRDIEKFLDESTRTVRELSFKLSPHILQNFGLVEAVKVYVEKVKKMSSVSIHFNSNNTHRFDNISETIAYRVICECISNTIKHANASEIEINMYCENDILFAEYCDNGKGFNVDAVMKEHKGIGLLNMQSRLKSTNGLIDILSTPGKGTIIKFQMKIQSI